MQVIPSTCPSEQTSHKRDILPFSDRLTGGSSASQGKKTAASLVCWFEAAPSTWLRILAPRAPQSSARARRDLPRGRAQVSGRAQGRWRGRCCSGARCLSRSRRESRHASHEQASSRRTPVRCMAATSLPHGRRVTAGVMRALTVLHGELGETPLMEKRREWRRVDGGNQRIEARRADRHEHAAHAAPCRSLARSLSARRAKEASVTPLLQAPRALALSAVAFRTEHGCGAQGRCSLQQSDQTERCWAAWAALGAELWPAADGSRCGQRRAAPGVAQDRYAQRSGAVLGAQQGFVGGCF